VISRQRPVQVGKWHLGFHQAQYLPTRRGFEEYFGILTGGGGHTSHKTTASFTMRGPYKSTELEFEGFNLWHNGATVSDDDALVKGRHSTDIYTDVAKLQLTAAASSKQPFFAYVSHQAVHAPMEVGQAFVDGTVPNGCDAIAASEVAGDNRMKLCGMMSHLDASAASLVDHLKSDAMDGAWDSTVFMFLSDNGGIEAHGSSNAPYRGGKGTYYEGGLRVPAFVAGGFTANALAANGVAPYVSKSLVHMTDLHVSLLSLAKAPFASSSISGTSGAALARRHRRLGAGAAPPAAKVLDATNGGAVLASAVPSLDGVDQWAYLTEGAETVGAQSAAYAPRKEILHNVGTEAFGSGGALRVGDYKLMVTPKVSESEVVTYAQHVLQDGDFDNSDLSTVIAKKLLKGEGSYAIFNVAKNPTEREDGTCDEGAEACENLFGNADFKQVQIALLDAWKMYRDAAGKSDVAFADDGPLADPALFGGYWAAWRDELGLPYASYATAAVSTNRFDSETGESTGMAPDQFVQGKAAGNKYDALEGAKTWKREAKVSGTDAQLAAAEAEAEAPLHPALLVAAGAAVGAVAVAAAFTAMEGRRRAGESQGKYAPVASA
jgi:arylsulfatase I/J